MQEPKPTWMIDQVVAHYDPAAVRAAHAARPGKGARTDLRT